MALTDLGEFPLPATLANIVLVHLAILCALVIVTLPLLLGRYVIRRYSAFLVALAEMRADVSAGIWGEGLGQFSRQLESDPTIGASTLLDQGLAYVSASLSHFSASERIALLSLPQRLATPKLRYFGAAILCIWFLQFHQGGQVWDVLLLAFAVALLQGLTVLMLLNMSGHLRLTPRRAFTLAIGVLMVQALPLVSIEGLAYLPMHLTMALVVPGGFGAAGGSYVHDVIKIMAEFLRFILQAFGGMLAPLALMIGLLCYLGLNRFARLPTPTAATWKSVTICALVVTTSFLVSYKFFQSGLQSLTRDLSFRVSGSGDAPAFQQSVGTYLYGLSDWLGGPPFLEEWAWLRLSLPMVVGLVATIILFGPKLSLASPTQGKSD